MESPKLKTSYCLVVISQLKREVVRFLRQKTRVIGALGTPLVFWLLLGSGLGNSTQFSPTHFGAAAATKLNYLQYFFPGTIVLILLFTAIFSTISIIEDRREGFLQGILVSPIPRSAYVLGKLLGGTLLAFLQGLLFMGLSPFLGISMSLTSFLFVCAIIFTMSFGLTGLGFLMAWKLNSTQGFHALMNLLLMPLWFLSGAIFPISSAPSFLKWIMTINPLSYSVIGLQMGFYQQVESTLYAPATLCLAVLIGFSVIMFILSTMAASKKITAI